MFGPHLMLDGYGCDREQLEDLTLVSSILDEYPAAIGMTKIMPPYVFRYSGEVPEDWGVSGIVLIAESHIAIHTFPEKGYFSLDIFSCSDFDPEHAVQYIVEKFKATHYEKNVLQRGREFPRSLGRAVKIIESDRQKLAGVC
ncbi:MAG: adenosylmethionine decarboxylase [Bacteroidota bacterium]